MTNEDFKLKDTSGALANRFVGLQFYKNWLGCEDRTLTAKLKAELPGILNWTIEGWRRLNDDGAFNETTQSKAIVRRIHATGDQVAAFFYDRCKLDPLGSVPKARLLDQYEGWTRENDIRFPLNEVHFGRAILLCGRGEIIGRRVTSDGRKYQVYVGLKLLGDDAPAQEGPTSDQGGLP
jgi:putative DNA primase/helicase